MNPRRAALLREMGLAPLWRLRGADAAPAAADKSAVPQRLTFEESPASAVPRRLTLEQSPPSAVPRRLTLEQSPPSAVPQRLTPAAPVDPERAARIAAMDWPQLQQAVAQCSACPLHRQRKQAVLGVGDTGADWLFVGEGPGAEEDERGEPFVGQAGKLLDNMLAAIGLQRGHDVYIANAVKCRPPGNRTPEPAETAACFPFLQRQIALIAPRLIVALGRPAAQTLMGEEVKIAAARGRLFRHAGIAMMITYHPAYLLRNLPDKAKAWEDLCFAKSSFQGLKDTGPASI